MKCRKCGSSNIALRVNHKNANHTDVYCEECGAWLKFASADDKRILPLKNIAVFKEYQPGDYVVYINGNIAQIGKVKRTVERGCFVLYSEGETASLTPFENLYKINNQYVIGETSLGGVMF